MRRIWIVPALCAMILAPSTARAADERDLTNPTEWSWHQDVTAAQLTSLLTSRNERVVDLEVATAVPLRFTAATVKNAGPYAKASWWYPMLTAAEVSEKLAEHKARLIDIDAYNATEGIADTIRYAAVMVPNNGPDQKAWAWYPAATSDFIGQKLTENKARLIDLDGVTVNGQRRYAAIMINNTGANERSWGWLVNQPWSAISASLANARLLDITSEGKDRYTVVFEQCPCAGWWVMLDSSAASVRARAAQLGARIIDFERHGGPVPQFSAVMVDNLDAESRRIANVLAEVSGARDYGIYLKPVGGGVQIALQEDFVHEPLSSVKVIAHLGAMRQVEAGASLDGTIPEYGETKMPGDACFAPDGQQKKLRDVLADMMGPSSNTDWAATFNYVGRPKIEAMLQAIGMTRTEIRRVGCKPVLNRWTLRDAGKLYEGVANGTLLKSERDTFFAIMRGKPATADALVDQEAPAGMSGAHKALFKKGFAISHKDGDWTTGANGEIPAEGAVTRVGIARIPSCSGSSAVTLNYVYGVFLNGPTTSKDQIGAATAKAALELLRLPIRSALSKWAACASSVPS